MKRLCALLAALAALYPLSALAEPLPVMVSVAPQKYFVEKLAGPLVEVLVMVAPGADAHTFEPKPSHMAQAAKAKLYFAQGVEFEQVWLPRIAKANPSLTVVNVNQGITLLPLADHDHKHAKKDKHGDKETDPHTWTSPRLVKLQAATMAKALAAADPANAQTYQTNLAAFQAELDALDAQLRQTLTDIPPGATFIVFHPAWAYFAKDYGLTEMPIEAAGKEPGPRQLKELIEHAKKTKAKAIFIQPQFSQKTAQTVADAIGAKLVTADDLAQDWKDNLLHVAKLLRDALR